MPESAGNSLPAEPETKELPTLLVLASTYPRWRGDPEPGFVHELSRRLTSSFHVIVLGPHAPGALRYEIMDGVEVVRYRYAPGHWETLVNDGGIVTNLKRHAWKFLLVPSFVLMQAWQAWRLIRKHHVQVVHAHWLIPQGLICAMFNLLPGQKIPFLVTSHGADLFALKGAVLDAMKRLVVKKSAATTVVSAAMRGELKKIGADGSKVSVHSMGVDLEDRFTPDSGTQRSRHEILFVGRLVEKKGLRHLIDAMPTILLAHPSAYLTVVGFGPELEALRAQVERLRLTSKVDFAGAVTQQLLPDYYRRAAVFVVPFVQAAGGDQEGLGLVMVEALGCCCPVVAGDVPAVREVFGAMGVSCVQAADVGQLVNAITEVLDDPSAAQERTLALRDTVMQRFDWQPVAETYGQLLASCIRGRSATHAGEGKDFRGRA